MGADYGIMYFNLSLSTLLGVFLIFGGLMNIVWSEKNRRWRKLQASYQRWSERLQTRVEKEYWRKRFVAWHLIEHMDDQSAVIQDVRQARGLILAPALVGGGIAAILMSLAYPLLSAFATRGNWLLISDTASQDFLLFFYLGILLGSSLGYMLGFWLVRQQKQRLSYGDLQRRSLLNYRSLLWRWGFILLTLCYCGVIILDASAFKFITAFHIPKIGYVTNGSYGILALFPLAMLLTCLVGEFVMSHIARQPRLLVTADPKTARRADDMLRTICINWIQYLMLFVIFGFLASLDTWAYFGVHFTNPFAVVLLLLANAIFLTMVVFTIRVSGRPGRAFSAWEGRQKMQSYPEMKVES